LAHDCAAQFRHSFESAAPAQTLAAHCVLHAELAPHKHVMRFVTIGCDALQRFGVSSGPAVIALQWTHGAASMLAVGSTAASGSGGSVVDDDSSLLHEVRTMTSASTYFMQ
jgi:hypothetical protein